MQLWQPPLPDRYNEMTDEKLAGALSARRAELGKDLVILGHHYQQDEVIRFADFTGDSFKLSQLAAEQVKKNGAKYVVFAGVHFMAETADILTDEHVQVILPDLGAGCSMADMADYEDAIDAWELIHKTLNEQHKGKAGGWGGRVIPITYVNSTAAVKAFVGANGGACCTSSNAKRVFEWALAGGTIPKGKKEDIKILFLPDQHLGRNTAASFGIDVAKHSCVYDPRATRRGEGVGGATEKQINDARVILWAGHCSVHKLFRPEHCDEIRALDPEMKILVHPECAKEVVDKSDLAGSTEFIIKTIREAKPGSKWAVGTEVHLVNRIAREAESRGVTVRILSSCQCLCTTMYRIDEPHLLWVLDHLAQGKVVNRVQVHPDARTPALEALDRMLALVDAPALVD